MISVNYSGEVRWRQNPPSRAGGAIVTNGDVSVVAGDLRELNPDTSETIWQAHLLSEGTAAPVVG